MLSLEREMTCGRSASSRLRSQTGKTAFRYPADIDQYDLPRTQLTQACSGASELGVGSALLCHTAKAVMGTC
jgi:hypothetical protein